MSLEERKKRLMELKSRTSCQACGQRGHWARDPECPKHGTNKSEESSSSTGFLAVADFDEPRRGGREAVDDDAEKETAMVAHHRLDTEDQVGNAAGSSSSAAAATAPRTAVKAVPKNTPRALGTRTRRSPGIEIPPPPDPDDQTPCPGECLETIRNGVNVYVDKVICLDCGRITKEPRRPITYPSTCPHAEFFNRGSSKDMM